MSFRELLEAKNYDEDLSFEHTLSDMDGNDIDVVIAGKLAAEVRRSKVKVVDGSRVSQLFLVMMSDAVKVS